MREALDLAPRLAKTSNMLKNLNRLDTFSGLSGPLKIQLSHLVLSIIWNIIGVVLINAGEAPLGPTASLVAAALMLVLIAFLVLGAARMRWLYVVASLFIMLTLSSVIWSAFISNPALWPSDYWRYGGVILNGFGVSGALWGLSIIFFHLKTLPSNAYEN